MLAEGAVLSKVVITELVAVQPLLPVTVTVKVPAVLTVMVEVVAPVLHRKLDPLLAVSVVEVMEQFKPRPLLLVMEATGTVFTVTDCEAVAVHPAAEVTVTV